MALRGDKKLPFSARREMLLGYIETLTEYMDGKTYADFKNDKSLMQHGVAKVMEQIGELLDPRLGHAPTWLAREFHRSRHENVHEYSALSLEDIWLLMGRLDQLRDAPPLDQERPGNSRSHGTSV